MPVSRPLGARETMADILVIDDEGLMREMLQTILAREGWTVQTAINGVDGMRKIIADPARVVVTDIIMSGGEGIETIRELRKAFPDIRIIAMSGGGRHGAISFLDMASKLGAHATLPKPFASAQLVTLVRTLLQG